MKWLRPSPRKCAILLLALCAGLALSHAQTAFERTYSYSGTSWDYAYSVQQTPDGGYVLAGQTNPDTSARVYLIKANALGDTLWTRTYGGRLARAVQRTSDGGYIICGNSNNKNVYLVKTNPSGDTVWTRTYGGPLDDRGLSVQQTPDGGYIVAGYSLNESDFNKTDVYIVKTDSLGDTLWTRTYWDANYNDAYSVDLTSDGGYIIAGNLSGYYSQSAVYLIKTNWLGNVTWTKKYRGPSQEIGSNDFGRSVQQCTDGGYIVAGSTSSFPSSGGYTDVLLMKTNFTGDTLWTRRYGGPRSDDGYFVQQTSDGGYIVVGCSYSFSLGNRDVYLIKTDALGDTLWTRVYGRQGHDGGYSVQQTSDGGYVVTGNTTSRDGIRPIVWLMKTYADGRLVSVQDDHTLLPGECALRQNYPNPFNPFTRIKYTVGGVGGGGMGNSDVSLSVYDVLGREVAILVNAKQTPGTYEVMFDGSNLASGVYYYRMQTEGFVQTRKLLLIR